VAQATPGSIENLKMINGSQIESGFAQADLAGWAYNGVNLFSTGGRLQKLRAIASLFPVAVHLVIPADSAIGSLKSLRGKRVAVGEAGSGTAAVSSVLLAAAGLREGDITAKYLRPGPAGAELKAGTVDAMFLVGGYPVPAIREVAASMPVRLVPIEAGTVESLHKDFSFYYPTEIPAGVYPGVETATNSLGSSALWLVNAEVAPDLVFAITDSLWNPATAKILGTLDPIGTRIQLPRALEGLSVPLHPGAERFYREKGMPVDAAPKVAGEPTEKKEP